MTVSIRERLFARPRPTQTIAVRVDDTSEADAELLAARTELRQAQLRDREAEAAAAQQRVEQAQARVAEGFVEFTLTALPPADLEALLATHPPTPEQKRNDPDGNYNPETFPAAVLAACVDSDMSEDDWREFLRSGPVGQGEASALWRAAMQVNDRSPDVRVGNGWRGPGS